MSPGEIELSVSQARDRFSDAVNRAAFAGEITYVTRGRGHRRAAAIVPAELVERYEELLDGTATSALGPNRDRRVPAS